MTSTPTPISPAADLCTQALKALSERSPYEDEVFASRSSTLPFRVAAHLADGRRKLKKAAASHGEQAPEAPAQASKQPKGPSPWWEAMEAYFRPITAADIESLKPRPLLASCFEFLILKSSSEEVKNEVVFSGNEVGVSSITVKKEEEKPATTAAGDTSALPVQEVEKDDVEEEEEEEGDESLSMHWALGSKNRAILTTQRPTKKRKLSGSDAGLEKLLSLPRCENVGIFFCDVCCLGENGGKSNKIITCNSCGVLVHKKCYVMHGTVEETWVCYMCRNLNGMHTSMRSCLLCPKEGGAVKPVAGDHKNEGEKKFVHLFCSLWNPEMYVEDIGMMEPVVNIGGISDMRWKLVCNVCKVKHGVCVHCSLGTCRTAFHPICAREARYQVEIWGKFGCDNVEFRAYCSKHSTLQEAGSSHHTRKITQAVGDDFSAVKLLPETSLPKKLPKLRFSRKNKEISKTQTASDKEFSGEATLEQDSLALSVEGGDMRSSRIRNFSE